MKKVIERSRELIRSEELKSRHRVREEDFSRVRCLTFPLLLTVILRKSVKSLQLVLNELTQEFKAIDLTKRSKNGCYLRTQIQTTKFYQKCDDEKLFQLKQHRFSFPCARGCKRRTPKIDNF